MRAVDTNVVVRLIARDDEKQTRRAESFIADGAWVSWLVLAESVRVLESVYELTKVQLCTAISMLLEHRQLVVQDTDVVRLALDGYKATGGVGFTDCLAVEIARRNGHGPMGTFDRKLSRLPGAEAV
ncbi:MAG: type II toxin-antitoxin system VapC family toxin [Burkholderiaceae bacterium]